MDMFGKLHDRFLQMGLEMVASYSEGIQRLRSGLNLKRSDELSLETWVPAGGAIIINRQ